MPSTALHALPRPHTLTFYMPPRIVQVLRLRARRLVVELRGRPWRRSMGAAEGLEGHGMVGGIVMQLEAPGAAEGVPVTSSDAAVGSVGAFHAA